MPEETPWLSFDRFHGIEKEIEQPPEADDGPRDPTYAGIGALAMIALNCVILITYRLLQGKWPQATSLFIGGASVGIIFSFDTPYKLLGWDLVERKIHVKSLRAGVAVIAVIAIVLAFIVPEQA